MIRLLCLITLLTSGSAALAANTGIIRGTVLTETGVPLKDAQIMVRQTNLGAVSSDSGKFEIRQVPSGYRQVIAQMTGFRTGYQTIYIRPDSVTTADFELTEVVIPLPGISVEDSMPRVSVTATIIPIELKKVPSAVEIISNETIQEMGAMTVADAMMEARSTYLQGDEDRGLSASLRGLRSTHTLVLINGRRVAAGLRDNVNLDDLPSAMIERIEIVRGPSSALYGSDAIGGVVNIITKKAPEDMVAGISVRYGQSKYGEAANPFIKGYMAERAGSLGYTLWASVDRESQFDRYKGTPWTDGDKKNLRSGGVELSLDLTNRQLLQGGYERSLVKRSGIRPYFWGDGRRVDDNNRKSFFAEYNYVVPNRAEFMVRGNYYNFETGIAIFPEIFGVEENPFTQSDTDYRLKQDLYQFETRFNYTFAEGNHLALGAEARQEKRKDNRTKYDVNNNAVFLQNIIQPVEPVLFVLGARYDDHSQFGSTFSPKASVTLSLRDNLRLKSIYGRGIRAPSIFELNIESPTKESVIKPNPDLKAEKSNTWEIGIEGSASRFSGDIRFFRNDLSDMINPVAFGFDSVYTGSNDSQLSTPWIRPLLRFENIERAMSQGLEMGLTVKLSDRLSLTNDLTLVETRDKATDQRLLNKPDLLNNAVLKFHHEESGFKTGIRLSSVGTRIITDEFKADAYSLVHLFFSKKFGEPFELFGGVNNLLNNDPNIFGFVEGAGSPGTFFFLGITLELWDHTRY